MLLINKPRGMTSHDVIDHIRKYAQTRTVGHAGTLDPLAEGLLLVAVGREETKKISEYVGLPKTYEFTIRLGVRSETQDLEGSLEFEPEEWKHKKFLDTDDIRKALQSFVGKHTQRIPAYSAKKIHGKKMYELARSGETIPVKKQGIEIYSLELLKSGIDEFHPTLKKCPPGASRRRTDAPLASDQPLVEKWETGSIPAHKDLLQKDIHTLPYIVCVACVSSGTYIRQLAEDIAALLGTVGLAERICRTHIGGFLLKDAVSLEDLNHLHTSGLSSSNRSP